MSVLRLLRATSSSNGDGNSTHPRRMGLLLAVACLCIGRSARADDAVSEEARNHFRAGVMLLQDPDGARYEEAYREFKTAYGLSPSPKMLGNLGYAALKLERDKEAIDAYERYLREAPDIQPDERKQVESDLLTLKTGLVHVTLTIDLPGGTMIDHRLPSRGEPIINGYGNAAGRADLALRSGRHSIEVRFASGEVQTWQFDAMPGAQLEHVFSRPRVDMNAQPPRPSRTGPILVTAGGLALFGAAAVTGIMALDRAKRIEDACPGGTCPNGYGIGNERSDAYAFVRATDVLLLSGAVLTATGLGWLFFSRKAPSTEAPAVSGLLNGRF